MLLQFYLFHLHPMRQTLILLYLHKLLPILQRIDTHNYAVYARNQEHVERMTTTLDSVGPSGV